MGQGNYLPHIENDLYEMFYVSIPVLEDDEEADAQHRYEQWNEILEGEIISALPPSFAPFRYKDRPIEHSAYGLAESGTVRIYLADNMWSVAVLIEPTSRLGIRHMSQLHDRLAKKLKEIGYELYVRTGAWTSAPLAI